MGTVLLDLCNDRPPKGDRSGLSLNSMRSHSALSLIGHSPEMANLRMAIERLAACDFTVLITGESGTGTIYVVSNVGSFGDEVFKIGMTRRLEPADRIKELSDASVPFEFDVHAMIACDDAPKLEAALHAEFEDLRINKVNYRKEFFRLPVDRLRAAVANRAVDVSFTMVAEAREYRESVALSKMSPEEREKHLEHQEMALDAE